VLATDNVGRIVAAVGIHAAAMPTMFLCTLPLNSPWCGFFRRLDQIAATAMRFAQLHAT
jgi:hypothetical protein